MRRTIPLLLATALLSIVNTGCDTTAGLRITTGGTPSASRTSRRRKKNAPAAGVQYTVLLKVFRGANHSRIANEHNLKPLQEKLGWRGLFVISEEDRSELYWGAFDSHKAAQRTRRRAKAHRAKTGIAPFGAAIVAIMPGSDAGASEWDIASCREPYSLLVAVFEDQPAAKPPYVGRRDFAVNYCRQLRQEGREAYYHHGPRSSSVTIGSFGRDAVQIDKEQVIPQGGGRAIRREVKTPVDRALLRLMREFPWRAYNGREFENVRKDGHGRVMSHTKAPSMVILTPGSDAKKGAVPRANNRSGHWQSR